MTRLRNWPLTSSPSSGDVFIIDGASGTKTITYGTLKDKINADITLGNTGTGDGSSSGSGAIGAKAYVTQTGFDGSYWYWRAWSDGTRECWSIQRSEQHTSDSNGLYSYEVRFPWTFDNPPAVSINSSIRGDIFAHIGFFYANPGGVEWIVVGSVPNKTETYYVSVYAIGKVSSS